MDLGYWTGAARSLGRHLRSPAFARELVASGLRADQDQRVPRVPFFDAYPEFAGTEVDLGTIAYRHSNLDPFEQYAIAAIARLRKPRRIFEIGTYDGATTLLLARNAPAAEIFTIDLASDDSKLATIPAEIAITEAGGVGERFRGLPEAERITQLYGDSRIFDFSPWRHSIDLVMVDAGHEYENAKADTTTALGLLAPGGIVIWDDYIPAIWPGVVAAVNEASVPAFLLGTTELAVYDSAR